MLYRDGEVRCQARHIRQVWLKRETLYKEGVKLFPGFYDIGDELQSFDSRPKLCISRAM
jgi:hypothetical protein